MDLRGIMVEIVALSDKDRASIKSFVELLEIAFSDSKPKITSSVRGRKSRLTPAKFRRYARLVSSGLSPIKAGKKLGISHAYVYSKGFKEKVKEFI